MGIYFDYNYEDGKEVEIWLPCFTCGEKKVLMVEYQIKKGPIYVLLNDEARKLWSGREIKVASESYLVCEDCYKSFPSEDELIARILKKKKEQISLKQAEIDTLKVIEQEIEETKAKINELLDKLGLLYERLGREKLLRQQSEIPREE
jgi:uncharacterized protein YbaR (Trm112 family)